MGRSSNPPVYSSWRGIILLIGPLTARNGGGAFDRSVDFFGGPVFFR